MWYQSKNGTIITKPMKYFASLVVLITLATAKVAWSENHVIFLPKQQIYIITIDTTLTTRDGKTISLQRGTRVHVVGFTQTKAFIVSRKGHPDGFVKKAVIVAVKEDEVEARSPLVSPKTGNREARQHPLPRPRISGGPYGGSIGVGPANIHINRKGKVIPSISIY